MDRHGADSLPALSGQSIEIEAFLLDAAGNLVRGPHVTWEAFGEDRLATRESEGGNTWTVRGHAEVHTVAVRLKDRPDLGASYHARVFDQRLRFQVVSAALPAEMPVGESAQMRVRVLTAGGVAVPDVKVSFLPEFEGWRPCTYGCNGPPYACWITPVEGWVGEENWVRTDGVGDAAALFTAITTTWTIESSRRFDVRLAVFSVPGTPPVGDTIVGSSRLVAGQATMVVAEYGQNQTGQVGTTLALPFSVLVTDRYGNRVANEPMAWTVTSGGGRLVWASSETGDYGQAGARLLLGPEPGPQTVVASIAAGASVTFMATAVE